MLAVSQGNERYWEEGKSKKPSKADRVGEVLAQAGVEDLVRVFLMGSGKKKY